MKRMFLIILILFPVFWAEPAVLYAQDEVNYYTCGMHPNVRVSPEHYTPGEKCPICGMPLIPVRKQTSSSGEQAAGEEVVSRVNIGEQELQRADVETVAVKPRQLFKEIRTVGTVAFDPKLAVAEEEFISAVKTFDKIKNSEVTDIVDRAGGLVDSGRRKLELLGLSADQVDELAKTRKVQNNLILPEDRMWIYGDVDEQDVPWIHPGSAVEVTSVSYPGRTLKGTIAFVNPVMDIKTRSLRFRALVDNPGRQLKPQMYVDVTIKSRYQADNNQDWILSVPAEAVLDTGRRKIVWVEKSKGQFEGRKVEVGPMAAAEGEDQRYYPILAGLKDGEQVVTRGNFLIDSQSQITGVSSASAFGGTLDSGGKKERAHGSMSGMPGM